MLSTGTKNTKVLYVRDYTPSLPKKLKIFVLFRLTFIFFDVLNIVWDISKRLV